MNLLSSSALTTALVSTTVIGLCMALPLPAQAQDSPICGSDVKKEVATALAATANKDAAEQLKLEASIYEKYQYCAADAAAIVPADPFFVAARQCGAKVSYAGSMFYESMPCCGYDPQRRVFACPVTIKQPFGFGGSPLPGSRENVLHCVADPSGVFRPVGYDSVHLSDSIFRPTWQFAVVANANDNLWLVQPMNGAPRIARSILSWQLRPTDCNYRPIWGNVIDYQIRLDQ